MSRQDEIDAAVTAAVAEARAFLQGLDKRATRASAGAGALERVLGGPLPEVPCAADEVVRMLARGADEGIMATAGPRYFGFVTGGVVPAALGAEWLAVAWDQNACNFVSSPAAAVVESIAARWLLELLDLPREASVGFTTGATMANFTALAAARHAQLARYGWDVEADGMQGAPRISVVAGDAAHAAIDAAIQMLGLGRANTVRVACDAMGRMRADALADALGAIDGPTIVCAQAGEVNTGAFDDFTAIVPLCRARGAWLHIDGAFGYWVAADAGSKRLVAGGEGADSWTLDGHKWLNVPYDSGFAVVRDGSALRAAMTVNAAYYPDASGERDNSHHVPEASRRARGFAVWAALRSLGRAGVADIIARNCALARRMAKGLAACDGVEILNELTINQVLVRFHPRAGDAADFTPVVLAAIQHQGTCWMSGTRWNGAPAARISISNWRTSEDDIDRAVAAIAVVLEHARASSV